MCFTAVPIVCLFVIESQMSPAGCRSLAFGAFYVISVYFVLPQQIIAFIKVLDSDTFSRS